jgi:hypothetical protein
MAQRVGQEYLFAAIRCHLWMPDPEHRRVPERDSAAWRLSFALARLDRCLEWVFSTRPTVPCELGNQARVAKLADAPDLGLRNHRFQNVALRFKSERF